MALMSAARNDMNILINEIEARMKKSDIFVKSKNSASPKKENIGISTTKKKKLL